MYYFYDMNTTFVKILFVTAILIAIPVLAHAQNPQQEQKSPEEIAIDQALKLQRDLKLSEYQLFFVDSILKANFTGQFQEFENMRSSGLQSQKTYENVFNKWKTQTEDAFEKILDREQFERFLKISGVPAKERKKRLAK